MYNNAKYGNKYQKLIEKEIARMEADILLMAKDIQRQGQSNLLTQKIAFRKRLIQKIKTIFNNSTKGAWKEAYNESQKLFEKAGYGKIDLTKADLETFKQVKITAFDEITSHIRADVNTVWKNVINFSVTGDIEVLRKSLLAGMDGLKIKQYGNTIVNTSIDTFYRTVNGVKGLRAGVEKWKYYGPPPDREFCNRLFTTDRIFTIDEINLMQNGQNTDVFFTGGGYNCRHYWGPYE